MSNQNPSPASGGRGPKIMSSRLMTMKFMQRAAASNSPSTTSPSAPAAAKTTISQKTSASPSAASNGRAPFQSSPNYLPSTSNSKPSTVILPTHKRRRVEAPSPDGRTPAGSRATDPHTSSVSSPGWNAGGIGEWTDLQRIQAAVEEEDARRESAIEILAAEAGETRWVLSTLDDRDSESMATATATATGSGTGLRVTRAGFAEIDGTGRDGGSGSGRRRFGRGSGKNETGGGLSDSQSDASVAMSDSDEDGGVRVKGENDDERSDSEDDNGVADDPIRSTREDEARKAKRLKAERKANRKAEEQARLGQVRRSKEVNLNRISSISGGGGGGGKNAGTASGKPDLGQRECYLCGQKGHEKRDCPRKRKSNGFADGEWGGKRTKREGERAQVVLDY